MIAFNKDETLNAAWQLVNKQMSHDASGHDVFHVKRVVNLAKHIASKSGFVDDFLLELSCILHDIDDPKLVRDAEHTTVISFLESQNVPPVYIDRVMDIIENLSYTATLAGKVEPTLEGKIAQDADRLDAIGAIGIARAFAFGGHKGRLLDDDGASKLSSYQHFEDKLLKLEGLMNTKEAKLMAKKRTDFIRLFLKQFQNEKNLID